MSPDNVSAKTAKKSVFHKALHNAILMTEVGMDLKERYLAGEKYICYLKSVITGADKAISALHFISKSSLEHAQHLILSIADNETTSVLKHECDRLLNIIEKQLTDLDFQTQDGTFENMDVSHLCEKIKYLETRQKQSECYLNPTTSSSKNLRADVNEKYPENLSRESLIDLNTVVNLPPVPEDIFTSFSTRPTRSSSLSSLKSMRKIKMFLQRAESSDDEDSSDAEEHDFTKLVHGDSDEGRLSSPHSPATKKFLGNIKEETQD